PPAGRPPAGPPPGSRSRRSPGCGPPPARRSHPTRSCRREIVRPVDPVEALVGLRDSPTPRLVLWPDDGGSTDPASVGLLSGSFDPPTVGHEELARAAARRVELVVL